MMPADASADAACGITRRKIVVRGDAAADGALNDPGFNAPRDVSITRTELLKAPSSLSPCPWYALASHANSTLISARPGQAALVLAGGAAIARGQLAISQPSGSRPRPRSNSAGIM